jgi:hypothetical protein
VKKGLAWYLKLMGVRNEKNTLHTVVEDLFSVNPNIYSRNSSS